MAVPVGLYAHQPSEQEPKSLQELAVPLASGQAVQNPFLDPNPPVTMMAAGLVVTTPTEQMPGPHGTPPGPCAVKVGSPPLVAPSSSACK